MIEHREMMRPDAYTSRISDPAAVAARERLLSESTGLPSSLRRNPSDSTGEGLGGKQEEPYVISDSDSLSPTQFDALGSLVLAGFSHLKRQSPAKEGSTHQAIDALSCDESGIVLTSDSLSFDNKGGRDLFHEIARMLAKFRDNGGKLAHGTKSKIVCGIVQGRAEMKEALTKDAISLIVYVDRATAPDEAESPSTKSGEKDSGYAAPESHFQAEKTCSVGFDRETDPIGERTYFDLYEMVRKIENRREEAGSEDWGRLIGRFQEIAVSGRLERFGGMGERTVGGAPVNYWYGVHAQVCDLLGKALAIYDGLALRLASEHGREIIDILRYMFGYAYGDPSLRDAGAGTGVGKGSDIGKFTEVSRSLRGCIIRAMWGLMVRRDGLGNRESDPVWSGTKDLFRRFVKLESHPLTMFLVGYHFPSFFWRDKGFGHAMLPLVFPEEKEKESLYVAAWTGYLVRTPSEKMLDDQKILGLYRRGLSLAEGAKNCFVPWYHDDCEAGIAKQLAFAHMRFEKFGLESDLISRLLRAGNAEQYASFIDCIGRQIVLSKPINADLMRDRLPKTWRRILQYHREPKTFEHFGTWINAKDGLFDMAELAELTLKTLEKSNGALEWGYGLVESMPMLEKHVPEMASRIARLRALGGAASTDGHPSRGRSASVAGQPTRHGSTATQDRSGHD